MPLAGAQLLPHMPEDWRVWALTINFYRAGAGSMMYLGLLSLTLFRKFLHKPPLGVPDANGGFTLRRSG